MPSQISSHNITIEVETDLPLPAPAVRAMLARAVAATLEAAADGEPAALAILLTGEEHIRQLNQDFLGEDKPTDVLSFPAGDVLPGMETYLGDVAIAVPVAAAQAAAGGHDLLHEMGLLAVHGVLHLLGYDHAMPEEQAEMWQVQDGILAQLELPLRSPLYGDDAV